MFKTHQLIEWLGSIISSLNKTFSILLDNDNNLREIKVNNLFGMPASQLKYFYLRPSDPFGAYVYGSHDSRHSGVDEVPVSLVRSRRWTEGQERLETMPISSLRGREVSKKEAISGIGTYVGSYLCVALQQGIQPKSWAYGVVRGYD